MANMTAGADIARRHTLLRANPYPAIASAENRHKIASIGRYTDWNSYHTGLVSYCITTDKGLNPCSKGLSENGMWDINHLLNAIFIMPTGY